MRVIIDYSDGHFSMREAKIVAWGNLDWSQERRDEHIRRHSIEIDDQTWLDYLEFCKQDRRWHKLIRDLDNAIAERNDKEDAR